MSRRLAILAGAGRLVPHLMNTAAEAGDTVEVISLVPDLPFLEPHKYRAIGLEHPDEVIAALRRFAPSHLVLAGSLSVSDAQRTALIRELGGQRAASGDPEGDVAITSLGGTLAALVDATLVGAHEIAADLLAEAGDIAGPRTEAATQQSALRALRMAQSIGALDLGQSVVTVGNRFVAAEDIAGTDALIDRVGDYRARGLTGDTSAPLILAKASKPHQPLSVDMPAIGPDTVTNCARAGISLIALEAGRCLVLDRDELRLRAAAAGISVVALSCDD